MYMFCRCSKSVTFEHMQCVLCVFKFQTTWNLANCCLFLEGNIYSRQMSYFLHTNIILNPQRPEKVNKLIWNHHQKVFFWTTWDEFQMCLMCFEKLALNTLLVTLYIFQYRVTFCGFHLKITVNISLFTVVFSDIEIFM